MNEGLRARVAEYLRPIRVSEAERNLLIALTEVVYQTGRRDGFREAQDVENQVSTGRSKNDVEESPGGKH